MPTRKQWLEQKLNRLTVADAAYMIVVSCLVLMSVSFPVYVHLHGDEFGPPEMKFYGEAARTKTFEMDSPIIRNKLVAQLKPRLELDQIVTGSINRAAKAPVNPETKLANSQPFPAAVKVSNANLELLFVDRGRLLAVEGGRVVTLRKGSALADGSEVTDIVKSGSSWIVKTSTGIEMVWRRNQ